MSMRATITLILSLMAWLGADTLAAGGCHGYTWVDFGYRRDNLEWKAVAPESIFDPVGFIDESWEDQHMWQADIWSWHSNCYGIYWRWRAIFASAYNGSYKRTLYVDEEGDDFYKARQIEGSSRYERAFDLSGGIGYQFIFDFCGYRLFIAPVVSFAAHEQYFRRGCAKVKCDNFFSLGSNRFKSHKRRYRSRWWGASYGGDIVFEYCPDITFTASGEYYAHITFRGRESDKNRSANRSLILHQRSGGHAWYGEFAAHWAFRPCWLFNLGVTGGRFDAHGGEMKSQLKPLGRKREYCFEIKERTDFVKAFWFTYGLVGGLEYRY